MAIVICISHSWTIFICFYFRACQKESEKYEADW
jgi:hypothetical protein